MDRTAILGTLKEWAAGMSARDMLRVTTVCSWCATSKSVVETLGSKDVTSVVFEVKPRGEPQVTGDTARIVVDRKSTVKYKQGAAPPLNDSPTVTFARKAQGWVIDGVK
jgi:hypothetical protein